MRAIVEALVASANFAALVRDEAIDKELRRCAERLMFKLSKATDRVIEMREGK